MRALRIAGYTRKMSPDFLGGENRDRCQEAQQCFGHAVDGSLRGAPRTVSLREGVESVFQHVEIKSAEIDCGIIVQRVEDAMEFKSLVPLAALLHQIRRARKHPTIELFHFSVRHRIARGTEIGK